IRAPSARRGDVQLLRIGWFGADAAAVAPGKTVVIVGDGAVGLCRFLLSVRASTRRQYASVTTRKRVPHRSLIGLLVDRHHSKRDSSTALNGSPERSGCLFCA